MSAPAPEVNMVLVESFSTGPFVGTLLCFLLYGATCMQTYQYYNTYPSDPKRMKFVVAFVFALETVHTSFAAHYTYDYLIGHYGDQEFLTEISWSVPPSIVIGFIIAWVVNQFFVRRIYVLSKRSIWLSGTVGILATVRPAIGIAVAALTAVYPEWQLFKQHAQKMMICSLTIGVAVDGLIAFTVSYYLVSSRNTIIASTRNIINALLKYTLNTGAILMIFAVFELLALLVWPRTLTFFGLFQIQIQLYANCFLTNLNARESIRRDNTPMVNLTSDNMRVSQNRTHQSSAGIEIKTETFIAHDSERRKSDMSLEKIAPHQQV